MGIRSTSLIKVTSKDSCSNIGDLRTRWLGEPLCYGGSRVRESAGAAQNYDQASLRHRKPSACCEDNCTVDQLISRNSTQKRVVEWKVSVKSSKHTVFADTNCQRW